MTCPADNPEQWAWKKCVGGLALENVPDALCRLGDGVIVDTFASCIYVDVCWINIFFIIF